MIISLVTKGQRALVIGSTSEARSRAIALTNSGFQVFALPAPPTASRLSSMMWRHRAKGLLQKCHLVVAADRDKSLNRWLWKVVDKYSFLLNTLDEKDTCNFFHLAVRTPMEGVSIAVSTDGHSPSYASKLSDRLQSLIGDEEKLIYESFKSARSYLKEKHISTFDFDWSGFECDIRLKYSLGEAESLHELSKQISKYLPREDALPDVSSLISGQLSRQL